MKKISIDSTRESIREGIDFIEAHLKQYRVSSRDISRTLLVSEEVLAKCINSQSTSEKIHIYCYKRFTKIYVTIKYKGENISITPNDLGFDFIESNGDDETENVIRNLILNSYGKNITEKYSHGTSTITQSIDVSMNPVVKMLMIMVLGIVAGIILKFLPENISSFIDNNILDVVSAIILNAMKMLVVPLVFFSITSSVAQMDNLAVLGRIGGKVFGLYIVTSLCAVLVGAGMYYLFPISNEVLAASFSMQENVNVAQSFSLSETIIGIVPDNFFGALTGGQMLQIMFISIIIGIAAIRMNNNRDKIKAFLEAGNDLFSAAITIIVGILPFSVFCSMASLTYSFGISSLLGITKLWIEVAVSDILMVILVYSALLVILGKLNPVKFIKDMASTMILSMTILSSNAMIPYMMKACKKMGISEKIYSFSIPMGATVNMDASCIFQLISVLYLAKSFGVAVPGSVLIVVMFTILLLSVGSPGVAGGSLVSLSLVLPIVGVPAEAVGLLMVVYTFICYVQVGCNLFGDAAVTAIVAKQEGLMEKVDA